MTTGETSAPASGGLASWTWPLQAASGVLLLLFAFLHMVAHHFSAPGGLRTYREVIEYLTTPSVIVIETLLSATVIFHALAGVRSILLDVDALIDHRPTINKVLVVVGVLMFLYGLFLTLSLVRL
jgi:succinate dehydrogenase / fumarate reductase membrane anchor subunit